MRKLLSVLASLALLAAVFPADAFALGEADTSFNARQALASDLAEGDEIIRNDETGIPDKNLYKAILRELGRSSGTFTKKEAASLHGLTVDHCGITDLAGLEYLTELEVLWVHNNKLKGLPDLTGLVKLDAEFTYFLYNKIPAKELKEKLPAQLVGNKAWLKDQTVLQNVVKTVKLKKPKAFSKVTVKTKTLKGKAHPNVSVRIKVGGKTVKTVKTNSKGEFVFKKLDLRKHGGKKAKLEVYHNSTYHGERWTIKAVSFTISRR